MKNIVLLLSIIGMSGCIVIYEPINPKQFNYNKTEKKGEHITYGYQGKVLSRTGNTYFEKQGKKKDVQMFSVKIQNHTDKPIYIKKQIKFYSNDKELTPLGGSEVVDIFAKENIIAHPNGSSSVDYVSSSNKRSFIKNFAYENIMAKKIEPQKAVYGLVVFRNITITQLEIRFEEVK